MVQKRSFLPFLAQKAVFGNFFEVLCDARTIYANKEESSEYLKKTSQVILNISYTFFSESPTMIFLKFCIMI